MPVIVTGTEHTFEDGDGIGIRANNHSNSCCLIIVFLRFDAPLLFLD